MSREYSRGLDGAGAEGKPEKPCRGRGDATPFLHELPQTVQALRGLARDTETRSAVRPKRQRAHGEPQDLSGFALTRLLHSYGLTMRRSAFASSPEESAVVARGIGFPVSLKLIAPALADRPELEGIAIDLDNARAVRKAASRMLVTLRECDEEAAGDGFIVQETATGVEIIVGVAVDPAKGPFMVAGLGNSAREAAENMVVGLLPVDEQAAAAMLRSLMGSCGLDGDRFDIAALASVMAGLSRFFLDHRSRLVGVEIAPLIAPSDGREARVGNVRFVLADAPTPRRDAARVRARKRTDPRGRAAQAGGAA